MPELEPVDLTITSPPYDNLRDYHGYMFNFERIAGKLYQITKEGGVVVWVVGDETINGSESGESFRQALYFKKIGFRLCDTMVYKKGGQGATGSNMAYWQDFEYMFILTKGKLKTFNPLKDRLNKTEPKIKIESSGHRYANGKTKDKRIIQRKKYGKRFNVWEYHEHGTKTQHPAVFPKALAQDHIISWSNKYDTVLDPMSGSGTVPKMCEKLNRRWLACEISEEYCEIAAKRIKSETSQLKLFR